eukprot:2683230-Pleurochrysis_carterae.AAC.1
MRTCDLPRNFKHRNYSGWRKRLASDRESKKVAKKTTRNAQRRKIPVRIVIDVDKNGGNNDCGDGDDSSDNGS